MKFRMLFVWVICFGLISSVVQRTTDKEQLELAETYEKKVAQFFQQGKFEQALPLAEKALKIRTEILGKKHFDTLTSMLVLAVIYQDIERLSEALLLFEKVYRLHQDILGKKHPNTIIILNNLASIYRDIGRLSEALLLFEKGYHLRQEILGEKHPDTIISLSNLAIIYEDTERLFEALPLFEKVYHLSKEVLGEKHQGTLIRLNNLAMIYQDIGRLYEALPLFEKSYRLHKEVLGKKHPDTISRLNNLASIYQDVGRLSEALPSFEKGYHLRQDILGEKHPDTLISLNNLAMIYKYIGRLSEALSLSEKSYRLHQDILGKKHPNTIISLNNLALIYQELGQLSEALPLSKKAYHLSKEVLGEKHHYTVASLNNLALIYQNIGQLSEALPLFEKGYHLAKELLGEKHLHTLISLDNLASIYKDMGRLFEALLLSKKSYHLFKEVLGEKHPETLNNMSLFALIYKDLGEINKAIKYLEKLVKGVEHLRSGDFSAKNRQAIFKRWVYNYFVLSYLYINQFRLENAFRISELSKARTLLESLAAKRASKESGLTKTEQDKLQDYEVRLASFNNQIGKALEDKRLDDRASLETDKNKLIIQLSQFERQLKAKYIKYAHFSKVRMIRAKQGAKLLPADTVLISYLADQNLVLAFTLQNNGKLTAHNLGVIPELTTDIEKYRGYLSFVENKNRSDVRRFGKTSLQKRKALNKKLAKHLLEPLKDIIKDKTHWIISPSGALATLPFETLRMEGSKQRVIAKHQISYVQSLSVFAMLKKRDEAYKSLNNRGTLLAMGAPLYEKNTAVQTNPSTIDYNIARQLVIRGGDYARALRQLNMNWQTLPGSLKELEQLGQLFKETKPSIYIKADATETKLQSLNQEGILAKYRYLVFSAHGYLSPQVPALSSIVLGQVNNPEGTDGYVTAGEWPGYDLKSDLMVLSACQTGLGEVVSGEGVMGLPYAFFVAGNKNTILTLWSISDEVTVEFITSFFTKLKAGVGQIEALTATKREFLNKGGKYANPAYWAAFVLYGV